MSKSIKTLIATAAVGLAVSVSGAQAQTTEVIVETEQVLIPTEQQIEQYVAAAKKIDALAVEYRTKIGATQNEDAKQALRLEADEKMVDIAHENGLTVKQYNGISHAVRQDNTLRQHIEKLAAN